MNLPLTDASVLTAAVMFILTSIALCAVSSRYEEYYKQKSPLTVSQRRLMSRAHVYAYVAAFCFIYVSAVMVFWLIAEGLERLSLLP